MKGILEFDINDPHEKESFEIAQNGYKYKLAIDDYDQWLRGLAKYSDQTEVSIEEARAKLRECVEEYFD